MRSNVVDYGEECWVDCINLAFARGNESVDGLL